MSITTFDEYEKKALSTMIPLTEPGVSSDQHWTLGLTSEVGEIAGKAHKRYRDPTKETYAQYRESMKAEFGDVLWELTVLIHTFGFSLETIANSNIVKLASRAKRGKITGSGDNR